MIVVVMMVASYDNGDGDDDGDRPQNFDQRHI